MTQDLQSTKLGKEPIGKLILHMSGPSILSMLVQALYNVVDSIFVGMYDATNGVLALSYAMPMQLLVNAFAIGFAVGCGSVISRKLGEGKNVDASAAAQTGLLLSLLCGLTFLVIGYFVANGFISAYTTGAAAKLDGGADWAKVQEMGTTYLTICICCSIGVMVETMLNRILQAMGNMIIPMIAQLTGAITNIILDPIFILAGNMGAVGAAIATVTGQIASMFVPLIVLTKKHFDIQIFFKKGFRVQKAIVLEIIKVGLPSVVLNAIGSIMYMISNVILNGFKDAVWAFGIYFKVQSFVFMPVFGLNQGCMPIMGYNYGANNRKRFDKTFFTSMLIAFGYMTLGLIVFHSMPQYILALFSPDTANKVAVGSEALRLCSIAFVSAGVSVIMIAMFNAIGQGVKAMLISLLRQIGILVPLGYVLSNYTDLGLTGFWVAFPVAEFVTTAIFFPIALATIKKIFKKKDEEQALRMEENLALNPPEPDFAE